MIKKLLSIIATGLFLSSCVTVDRSYSNNADNQMLCEQTWKNLSLETSRDEKKRIRAELTRRGVVCTSQLTWKYSDKKVNTASAGSNSVGISFTIKDKKEQCTAIGFKPATDKFADCVLRLVELDLQKQISNPMIVAQDSGNQAIVDELKRSNNMQQSQFLMNLSNQLLNPSSPASSMSSSSCTVRGGTIKTINCW